MVVNRAMASQPMCVSRLRNMVEPLYSNPNKDPATIRALNDTKVPPPFKVPVVHKENFTNKNTVTTNATINSKITGNYINASTNNMYENGGWEVVHQEPPVDIRMDEIPLVGSTDDTQSMKQPNGLLQHNNATLDPRSPPRSITPTLLSPDSAVVRTYTPLTISSEEEGTASESGSENLEDSTIGLLRPKKKHAFNAPDLFTNTWKPPKNKPENSDALSVSILVQIKYFIFCDRL